MKKRIFSAVMALMISVACLTSCGNSETGGSVKELNLTVWNTQGTDYVYTDLKEDIPSEWLKNKTGVWVENIYGNDGGQWDSKLTKLVTGNNLPDIIWCQGKQGPSHFGKIKQLDKLVLLTDDMIKQYAPNIWKRTPEATWDLFRTEDGKIMGIPFELGNDALDTVYADYSEEELANLKSIAVVPESAMYTEMAVRDDILKKIYPEAMSYDEIIARVEEANEPIGDELFDIPVKTTEEFIDFMYKIRDLNLKENGQNVYAFGYAGDGNDNWESLVWFGNMMYGGGLNEYTATWNFVDEKMEVPLTTDFIKTMAKTQNQMILDKVIDPESLAHTGSQFKAKIYQGQYAICAATRAGTLDVVNKQLEDTGKTFKYRPIYIDIPNPEQYPPFKVATPFWSSFCMLNTLTEDEVIRVLQWADLQYTDEFMEIYNWGTKEQGLYVENADGTRSYIDDNFNKFFLEKDASALTKPETKGMAGEGGRFILETAYAGSKWTPIVYNKKQNLSIHPYGAFRFSPESEYLTRVKLAPPCYAYCAELADIPEVVDYWAQREQWEIAIKKAVASSEGQFDAKWNEMLEILNDIVDVDKMEEEMTKIAEPYWNNIKSAQ